MNNSESGSTWALMKESRFELAYKLITEDIYKHPERENRHLYNRALCLLNLDRPEEALEDFQRKIILAPDSASGYIGAGIAFWWLERPRDAIEVWKRSISSKYTDAANGVLPPAFLLFAASRLANFELEKYAKSLLFKSWNEIQPSKIWPGAIAEFLLGKISLDSFLNEWTFQNATLEARRLCKTHFWIAVYHYREGEIDQYKHHLQESVSKKIIIEPEYYLAKYELQIFA